MVPRNAVLNLLDLSEKNLATTAISFELATSVLSSIINEYGTSFNFLKRSSLKVGPSTCVTSAAHFVRPIVRVTQPPNL